MQDGIHEIAGSVAGEGTAGAVGSVSPRGKAEDKNSGSWVAEARNGTSPIGLVLVGSALGFTDATAVLTEAGATFAGDDGFINLLEDRRYLCA